MPADERIDRLNSADYTEEELLLAFRELEERWPKGFYLHIGRKVRAIFLAKAVVPQPVGRGAIRFTRKGHLNVPFLGTFDS